MKQVKFHRTELSLSVSGAEFCALSENEGLSLRKLQEIRVLNEKLVGEGLKHCRKSRSGDPRGSPPPPRFEPSAFYFILDWRLEIVIVNKIKNKI